MEWHRMAWGKQVAAFPLNYNLSTSQIAQNYPEQSIKTGYVISMNPAQRIKNVLRGNKFPFLLA
jgi:hypothetical protein